MRRALLRNASLYSHHLLRPSPPPIATNPKIAPPALPFSRPLLTSRFFSSDDDSSGVTVAAPKLDIQSAEPTQKQVDLEVKDVSDEEYRKVLNKFLAEYEPYDSEEVSSDESDGDVQELGGDEPSSIVEGEEGEEEDYLEENDDVYDNFIDAVCSRAIAGNHDKADESVIDQLQLKSIEAALDIRKPKEPIDSEEETKRIGSFDEHLDRLTTDSDIDDLYNVREIVEERFNDNYLNVDDKKWDELIKEQTGEGYSEVMQQCTDILEDMENFDKLLPDEIKKKVRDKFEELGRRCERGELKPKEAFELFSNFEEEIINEHLERTEAEGPPPSDKTVVPYKTNEPPGEGPILRWQTRVVFSPGEEAWHPKNRKVKLSVTVKELGLTKHQFRRLRSLVGKRYHPGRDELTITSERFEHREENRKDCLRTLLSLIEEAGKAEKLVGDARASYVKERLKANPAFMERLNAKIMRLQGQKTVPVLT